MTVKTAMKPYCYHYFPCYPRAFCWLYSTSILELACFDRGSNQVIARLRIDWLNSNSGSSGDWNSLTSFTPTSALSCWGGAVSGAPCGSIRLAGERHRNVVDHIKLIKWNTKNVQTCPPTTYWSYMHLAIFFHFSSANSTVQMFEVWRCVVGEIAWI